MNLVESTSFLSASQDTPHWESNGKYNNGPGGWFGSLLETLLADMALLAAAAHINRKWYKQTCNEILRQTFGFEVKAY